MKNDKAKSKFKKEVIKIVNSIPIGKVASYGQVATYAGIPRAARQVGWILSRLEQSDNTPWWRVVNNEGRISIKGSKYTAQDQKELLEKENIMIKEDLSFDINKYRYEPTLKSLEEIGLDIYYLAEISNKIPYSKYIKNEKSQKTPLY